MTGTVVEYEAAPVSGERRFYVKPRRDGARLLVEGMHVRVGRLNSRIFRDERGLFLPLETRDGVPNGKQRLAQLVGKTIMVRLR